MADCKESKEETHRSQVPFMLKVDPPEQSRDDTPERSTNDEMEGQSTENNTTKSASPPPKQSYKIHYPILAASKFANSFGVNEFSNPLANKSKAAILRPSQLGAVTNKIVLQQSKLNNPFSKVTDSSILEDASTAPNNKSDAPKDNKPEEKPEEEAKPKFLPLGASTKDSENNVNSTVDESASTPSFVFGQNLKERVTVSSDTESLDNSEKEDAKTEETTNENGSSELLFSNAAAVCRNSTSKPGLTLTQAAQELEKANRANKRKYSQVTLLTGEEGETNVLQINCKLFAFDKATSGWQERGRGTLRLNDRDEESRLVGRAAGTQRLILNTKVWPGMTAERAGPKSLRLTAMDVHGDIRIFIVQAAPKEVDQLHSLLLQRLKRAEERQPKKLATDQ